MFRFSIFTTAALCLICLALVFPGNAYAMHIMEGFLPMEWSGFWYLLTIPFFIIGIRSINKTIKLDPSLKMLLGLAGAFVFVLSALKLPSLTGSCSHPTGIGLGAVIFGPWAMTVLGSIVLIFQAVFLAHGGLSTLGANTFSMAVAGPIAAYGIFKLLQKSGAPLWLSVFMAAVAGNLTTYMTTALQLALAFPSEVGGFTASFLKFAGVFGLTQVPLAFTEGLLTIVVFNVLANYSKRELQELSVIPREVRA